MDEVSQRSSRERDWHNKRFSDDPRSRTAKYYLALSNWYADYYRYFREWEKVGDSLELGAGLESVSLRGKFFGQLCSIDISETAVNALISLDTANNVTFQVADVHSLLMADESFDLIIGRGILHHLDLPTALSEIKRVLKSSGAIIFGEPLAGNPLIRIYRLLTPNLRSADEAPLSSADIATILQAFPGARIKYYGFLTLLPAIFGFMPPQALQKFDAFLLNQCRLGHRLAWACLIIRAPSTSTLT